MPTVVLDSNVYDHLMADAEALAQSRGMVEAGELVIICPATVRHELEDSPFGGVPPEIPVTHEPDSVFVLDHSRLDEARFGDGTAYDLHRGDSNKVADAVIVESAITDADLFVTQDQRARKRAKDIGYDCSSMTYGEFREQVLQLPAQSSSDSPTSTSA